MRYATKRVSRVFRSGYEWNGDSNQISSSLVLKSWSSFPWLTSHNQSDKWGLHAFRLYPRNSTLLYNKAATRQYLDTVKHISSRNTHGCHVQPNFQDGKVYRVSLFYLSPSLLHHHYNLPPNANYTTGIYIYKVCVNVFTGPHWYHPFAGYIQKGEKITRSRPISILSIDTPPHQLISS